MDGFSPLPSQQDCLINSTETSGMGHKEHGLCSGTQDQLGSSHRTWAWPDSRMRLRSAEGQRDGPARLGDAVSLAHRPSVGTACLVLRQASLDTFCVR